MNSANVAILNEHLLRRPEPIREDLALYITEHLDEIEEELHSTGSTLELSDDLKAELDRRMEAYEQNPKEGVSWDELRDRLLASR